MVDVNTKNQTAPWV